MLLQCQGEYATHRAKRTRTLLVEYLYQDLDCVRVLQDFEDICIHGKVFDRLEHLNEVLGFKKLASPQKSYKGML